MKQVTVKGMTLTDLILNIFYKVRFWSYRKFFKKMLKNTSSEDKPGKHLTFVDNFDEVSWSEHDVNSKWKVGEGWGMFHPRKTSVYYGEPQLIEGESLAKFTVNYEPKTFKDDKITGNPITIPYKVSLISTPRSFRQQYGRWECRCTIPMEKGVWPAFWMWGSTWPPEIDVFETYGNAIQEVNLHYGGSRESGTRSSMGAWGVRIQDDGEQQFHEFVCEWSPNKIEFYTDGVKIFRNTNKKVLKWFNKPTAQMWIVLNHSIQEDYANELTDDFYSEFLVDYVRTYTM